MWLPSYIFKKKTSGTLATTSFISGGVDLSNIFQPYDGSSVKADLTGYTVANIDLNNKFQNLVGFDQTIYNPFSATTIPTGYTYNIFSVSLQFITENPINNAYIFLIGGGGGGGSGLGYEGGGAGGNYIVAGPINLSGTYNITIGNGGAGGAYTSGNYNGATGATGGTTTITGPAGFTTLTATGGGGGGGSAVNKTGAGGTNGYSLGHGGTNGFSVTNVQGTGSGYGQNGYEYIFQDGSGTKFKFGGGGASGGRNSTGSQPPATLGGGGVFNTYGSTTFTAETGGCGGTGSYGISTFQGFHYTFNENTYNTGSGGGGGGNSTASNYSSGGQGCGGLAIIYYPPLTPFTTTGVSTFTYTNNTYVITFTSSGTIQFNFLISNANILVIGGGGSGGSSYYYHSNIGPQNFNQFGGGGAGGEVISNTGVSISMGSYNVTVGTSDLQSSFSSYIAKAGERGKTISGGNPNGGDGWYQNQSPAYLFGYSSDGGRGTAISWLNNTYYGGGGAGSGLNSSSNLSLGSDGGANGVLTTTGLNGLPNTGGGGSGGGKDGSTIFNGGLGGSGIVIIQFAYP